MPVPRILFGGGGSELDSRPLDELFAGWVNGGKLLYLPTALVDQVSMEAGCRWIQEVFFPLGLTSIEAWMDLSHKTAEDLAPFAAVYIGGGNTFWLLHQLRIHHLDSLLSQFILEGHPAYGGSAGALVLSKTITPSSFLDQDIVGIKDTSGMDLGLGWAVWCHYRPEYEKHITRYAYKKNTPCVAITERSGVYREGDHLYAAGYEPAVAFVGRNSWVVEAGGRVD